MVEFKTKSMDTEELLICIQEENSVELKVNCLNALMERPLDSNADQVFGMLGIVLQKHSNDVSIQLIVCQLVKKIAYNDKDKQRLLHAGVISLLLNATKKLEHSNIYQTNVWRVLYSLAFDRPTRSGIVQLGGINLCVDIMKRHQDVLTVQTAGCSFLRLLAFQDEFKLEIIQFCGIAVVLQAMNKFTSDLGIAITGCDFLYFLAYEIETGESLNDIPQILENIAQVVVQVMHHHQESEEVQTHGIAILRSITFHPETCEWMGKCGGFEAAIRSLSLGKEAVMDATALLHSLCTDKKSLMMIKQSILSHLKNGEKSILSSILFGRDKMVSLSQTCTEYDVKIQTDAVSASLLQLYDDLHTRQQEDLSISQVNTQLLNETDIPNDILTTLKTMPSSVTHETQLNSTLIDLAGLSSSHHSDDSLFHVKPLPKDEMPTEYTEKNWNIKCLGDIPPFIEPNEDCGMEPIGDCSIEPMGDSSLEPNGDCIENISLFTEECMIDQLPLPLQIEVRNDATKKPNNSTEKLVSCITSFGVISNDDLQQEAVSYNETIHQRIFEQHTLLVIQNKRLESEINKNKANQLRIIELEEEVDKIQNELAVANELQKVYEEQALENLRKLQFVETQLGGVDVNAYDIIFAKNTKIKFMEEVMSMMREDHESWVNSFSKCHCTSPRKYSTIGYQREQGNRSQHNGEKKKSELKENVIPNTVDEDELLKTIFQSLSSKNNQGKVQISLIRKFFQDCGIVEGPVVIGDVDVLLEKLLRLEASKSKSTIPRVFNSSKSTGLHRCLSFTHFKEGLLLTGVKRYGKAKEEVMKTIIVHHIFPFLKKNEIKKNQDMNMLDQGLELDQILEELLAYKNEKYLKQEETRYGLSKVEMLQELGSILYQEQKAIRVIYEFYDKWTNAMQNGVFNNTNEFGTLNFSLILNFAIDFDVVPSMISRKLLRHIYDEMIDLFKMCYEMKPPREEYFLFFQLILGRMALECISEKINTPRKQIIGFLRCLGISNGNTKMRKKISSTRVPKFSTRLYQHDIV